jgi:hypothetical protein
LIVTATPLNREHGSRNGRSGRGTAPDAAVEMDSENEISGKRMEMVTAVAMNGIA